MFKKNHIHYLFLTAISVMMFFLYTSAMELTPDQEKKRKEIERETTTPEADPLKRVKLSDDKTLESLPLDLLIKIIVTSGSTPKEVIDTVKSLMGTNKKMYGILSGQAGNKALIASLARKFFHYDQFQAAKVLNTAASRAWLTTAIDPQIQKTIQEIIKNNAVAIGNQNLSSITTFLDSTSGNSEITLKERFFSSAFARIWLIKKLLERTTSKIDALAQIKSALFPNTIDPDLDEWITFTQKHLAANIAQLVRQGRSAELKKLIDQGVDVSQNLVTTSPFIFSAQDAATLKLLIAAGADVNAIQPGRGNSALHVIINSDIDDESIKQGNSLVNPDNRNALLKVRALLEAGAYPNFKNAFRLTPLGLVNQRKLLARKSGIAEDPFLLVLGNVLKKYGAQ